MNVPPRAQLNTFGRNAHRTLMFSIVFTSIILLATMIYFAFPSPRFITIVITSVFSLAAIQALIFLTIRRTANKRHRETLQDLGFEAFKPGELEPELRAICTRTDLGFHNHPCRIAYVGEYQGRQILISEHSSWDVSQFKISTCWAVRSAHQLPHASIGPKSIFVDCKRTLGVDRFDQSRSLSTRYEQEIRELLVPLVDWFVPDTQRQLTLSGTRSSSKHEQWVLDNDWIILTDDGQTDANGMKLMAEFLTAFADQLEAQLTSE